MFSEKNVFDLITTSLSQDLENNLADVMKQSFKQCWDTRAKLRLLEVFEGISGRELVQVSNDVAKFKFITNR